MTANELKELNTIILTTGEARALYRKYGCEIVIDDGKAVDLIVDLKECAQEVGA